MGLSAPQKRRIVELLAQWYSPTDVQKEFAEEYPDLKLTRQAISHYDPETLAGQSLSPELTTLFHELRKKFKEGVENIPLANAAYRMRTLQSVLDDTGSARIKIEVVKLAEQISGGMFVARRDSDAGGDDAGKIPIDVFESSLNKIYGDSDIAGDPDGGNDSGPAIEESGGS